VYVSVKALRKIYGCHAFLIQSTENTEQSAKLGTRYHQDSRAVLVLSIYQLDQEKTRPNQISVFIFISLFFCEISSSHLGKEGSEHVHVGMYIFLYKRSFIA
jgi:hypothetical protein